ncbi:transposase family protein [Streptomyces globisporus]|uniref:helix-turn-helix domain-containing protein n=1 Tax=Streptomyces globisporus TaxID=1908 RepID=UPI0036851421
MAGGPTETWTHPAPARPAQPGRPHGETLENRSSGHERADSCPGVEPAPPPPAGKAPAADREPVRWEPGGSAAGRPTGMAVAPGVPGREPTRGASGGSAVQRPEGRPPSVPATGRTADNVESRHPCPRQHLLGLRRHADRLLATLVQLRHGVTHDVLACWFRVDRSTLTRAIGEVRPSLAERGCTVAPDVRPRTLAEVIEHLGSDAGTGIIDGTEVRVRRPAAGRKDREKSSPGRTSRTP